MSKLVCDEWDFHHDISLPITFRKDPRQISTDYPCTFPFSKFSYEIEKIYYPALLTFS